ncbi:hypothetical protein AB6813_04925 [bacterium RCC_150]
MSAIIEDGKATDGGEDLGGYAGGFSVNQVGTMAAAVGMTLAEVILRLS